MRIESKVRTKPAEMKKSTGRQARRHEQDQIVDPIHAWFENWTGKSINRDWFKLVFWFSVCGVSIGLLSLTVNYLT